MRSRLNGLLALATVLGVLGGCETTKSANPLSPSVAGPIPGVNITAPALVDPTQGAKIATGLQPLTLVVENATTNGQRPLSYVFEVSTDATFATPLFRREGVAPGADGRTRLKLPDALPVEQTYHWRARAEDGANTGPFSASASFAIFTPVVIEAPHVVAPAQGTVVATLRPTLRVQNAARTGPAVTLTYRFEVSTTQAFSTLVEVIGVPETLGETSATLTQDLAYAHTYFWRAMAYVDAETTGPWTPTYAFTTLAAPAPTPPPSPAPVPGGGYPNNGPDVVRYVEDKYPERLAAGVSASQREANMEFLRDQIIATGICGGMDLAWNLKRGTGPRSVDAIAWRTGGKVEVVDIGNAYDDTSKPLNLQWVIVGGPAGYDPFPTPPCK